MDSKLIQPLLRCDGKGKSKPPAHFSFAPCRYQQKHKEETTLKQSQVLHDFGQVLFCSLFLDKSQSAELISYFWQAGYDARWNIQQRRIINELISVYRTRLPLQRLKSDDTKTSVTIDSLSELTRCPRLLFNSLSPTDQERFRTGASLMANSKEEDTDTDDNSSYLFTRGHQNRFIPLMMHFLDFDADSKLRFAVDLGQFYYNVRLKPGDKFTDGRIRVRRLGQKVVAYGRLSDFTEERKPELWQTLEENCLNSYDEEANLRTNASELIQPLNPYIVKTTPHYHYYDDKIGLRIDQTGEPGIYPDLQLQTIENSIALDAIEGKEMMPDFWISPSQMLHLGFYTYLRKAQPQQLSLDNVLRKYRSGMTQLLKALAAGSPDFAGEPFSEQRRQNAQQWVDSFFNHNNGKQFSIALADLPKVVVHHLIGSGQRQVSVDVIMARAEHILEESEYKIKQIEKLLLQPKKRGKKGFKPIKCGHMGDFIVDDLMRFQPVNPKKPDDGGKLNSQQYQILQATLAYYGAHIDEPPKIVDLLNDAGLLKGDFAHPFLPTLKLENNPTKYSGLISFYKAYLQARKQFIQTFIKDNQQKTNITNIPRWLRLKQRSSLNKWLEEYMNDKGVIVSNKGQLLQPLPMLKNMLYQPILTMLAEVLQISTEELYQQGVQQFTRDGQQCEVRPAISWLIQRYLRHQDDHTQAMYHYTRQHNLFDTYLDKRGTKQRFQEKQKHFLTEQERQDTLLDIRRFINGADNALQDTEKKDKLSQQLKSYKRQEKHIRHNATQDMVLYLFAKDHLHALQLSDSAHPPSWSLKGIENTLLNTSIYYQIAVPKTDKSLYHTECKIRKLGEIQLLVRDKRLPSLMCYYSATETRFNQAEIRAELNSYRLAKVTVMKLVYELEGLIVKNYGSIKEKSVPAQSQSIFGRGRHGEYLYALYSFLHSEQTITIKQHCFNRARLIRNAFAHNKYPRETHEFSDIIHALKQDKIPENPQQHRKIAQRLVEEIQILYQPWLTALKSSKKKD